MRRVVMMAMLAAALPVAAMAVPVVAAPGPAGNAGAGKSVFLRCSGCHSVAAGETRIGPSLAGVVGRKAGTQPGYVYSPALKASGLSWTGETLDAFLTNPRKLVPGNRMSYPGLAAPADRANVIAYLATIKR